MIFFCENNLWMEYTRTSDVTAVANPAADRASAYGLESIIVDGNAWEWLYDVSVAHWIRFADSTDQSGLPQS